MESVVKEQLMAYLSSNSLINLSQHAFTAKHSTATNLLESVHDWTISINNSLASDILYVDFSRAFDTIVFSKLLYKLQLYGICGILLIWISEFLHNRTQCVVADLCYSLISNVLSGVPQCPCVPVNVL